MTRAWGHTRGLVRSPRTRAGVIENLDGKWWMEHGIEQGDEAVIEWTMTWRDPKSGEERLNRGAEWFRLRDGKIAEVRAYHHGDRHNPRGDLLGFDFGARGYTTLDDQRRFARTTTRLDICTGCRAQKKR